MAKPRKAGRAIASGPPLPSSLSRRMEFAGGSSGPLDTSALPAPEHPSARWAGLVLEPVRPRRPGGRP